MINILSSHRIYNHPKVKDEVLKHVNNKSKICVIAYSFFESEFTQESYELSYEKDGRWYLHIIEPFLELGLNEDNFSWVVYNKDSREAAINKIDRADVIFLPGGAPDLFVARLKEQGLFEHLKKSDKIMMGPSAGTMIQFDQFHISKDYDYKKFSIHEGLGFIKDFGVEVNYRRRKQQKKGIRRMSHLDPRPIYVVNEDGMMILEDNKIIFKYQVKKYYQNGRKIK